MECTLCWHACRLKGQLQDENICAESHRAGDVVHTVLLEEVKCSMSKKRAQVKP